MVDIAAARAAASNWICIPYETSSVIVCSFGAPPRPSTAIAPWGQARPVTVTLYDGRVRRELIDLVAVDHLEHVPT